MGFAVGSRAKFENSLTSSLRPSTWLVMVSTHSSRTRASSGEPASRRRKRRRMRWAESWMGVSGFLISWAMRRATSRQAAMRWARTTWE